MSHDDSRIGSPSDARSIERLVARALDQLRGAEPQALLNRREMLQGSAAAGAVALATMVAPGCSSDDGDGAADGLGAPNVPIPGAAGKSDWAQYEGSRDTSMVSYAGSYWHEFVDCQTRGGCMGVDVFVKLRVKQVDGANLDKKRVGIVYQQRWGDPGTALGTYYSTGDDGYEEWHVKASLRAWDPGTLVFNAWYQDGLGHTYFDDNEGEFHAVAHSSSNDVIRIDWGATDAMVTTDGVTGKLGLLIADLDYDKDVHLVWTTDGWATSHDFGMGPSGEKNGWYWVADAWYGYEAWEIELEIDGPLPADAQFEYAMVYKHGVVNGAKVYEFWNNNQGHNYVLKQS